MSNMSNTLFMEALREMYRVSHAFEDIYKVVSDQPNLQIFIYGSNPDEIVRSLRMMRMSGIFRGYIWATTDYAGVKFDDN